MKERLIKKLITSLKCTVCGQHYEANAVEILGYEDDLWFLKASCTACHAEFVVAVMVQESYEPVLKTHIPIAESARFQKNEKLTADDVLEMHHFLRNFNGDFSRIFNGKVF